MPFPPLLAVFVFLVLATVDGVFLGGLGAVISAVGGIILGLLNHRKRGTVSADAWRLLAEERGRLLEEERSQRLAAERALRRRRSR